MLCKNCGEEKIGYNREKICRECYIARQKKCQDRKKLYVYDYLDTHPCVSCGENRPAALEFHHKNSDEKEFSVSNMTSYSMQRIQKEIDKCDVLCSNCHKVITAKELGRYNFLNLPELNNGY